MTVIDFTQLLRDAKSQAKGSKKKTSKSNNTALTVENGEQHHEQQATTNNQVTSSRPLHSSTNGLPPSLRAPISTTSSLVVTSSLMPAIDFTQLLLDAKRQTKGSKKKTNTNTTTINTALTVEDGDQHQHHERPADNQTLSSRPLHSSTSLHPMLWMDQNNPSLQFEKLDLQKVCSKNPKSIFYSPACLADSGPLADWLSALPQGESGLEEWKTMKYGKRKVCMLGTEQAGGSLPPPLSTMAQQLVDSGIFPPDQPPNHVLLNEYQPSQGILPHTDGPLYASRTATFSLGSDVLLEFSKRLATDEIGGTTIKEENTGSNNNNNNCIAIVLHADSLIVFEDDAYLQYCHGIAMDVWEDTTGTNCLNAPAGVVVPRRHRYSLTFRHRLDQDLME